MSFPWSPCPHIRASKRAFAGAMEGKLLSPVGGPSSKAHPPLSLKELDNRVRFLQANAIETSTHRHYTTGARDYIKFCCSHNLSIEPTPSTLARYIAYSSLYISSAPKYLSSAKHFLSKLYPDFESNHAHPTVQSTVAGARKICADPVRRKGPLCLLHLESFQSFASSSGKYNDLLFATIMSCAFYACHRMGELVFRNEHSF